MAKREDIVGALRQLGSRGRGIRYPDGLRETIVEYARGRRAAGVRLEAIGEELGVSWRTVGQWLGSRASSFRKVQVDRRDSAKTAKPKGFTMHAAHGVRVEGLGLDDVVEVLRRLG